MQKDEVQKILDRFRDHVISQAKRNLTNSSKNASKSLYNSLKGEVKAFPNSIGMYFEMLEYGNYQDKGVKGANPSRVKNGIQKAPNSPFKFKASKTSIPTKVLDKWIVGKGIAPRNEAGQFTSRKNLKFLIARSIHAQGIKPSLFFTKPFEAAYKNLGEDLIDAYGLEATKLFNDIIKQPK